MSLSIVEDYSEELRDLVTKVVAEHSDQREVKEVISAVTMFALSHNLDLHSYIFDEQYSYVGTPVQKIKGLTNSIFDYLFLLFDHRDFVGASLDKLEPALKLGVYGYLEQKISDGTLNEGNYREFISYLQATYDVEVVLDIIRIRIADDKEQKEEYKALLEYMTFMGREYIEEDEFERLQHSINFRLNLLKNYNIDYFCKHFFLLKNHAKLLPDEYQSNRYFFPAKLLKDMKNLVLMIERGETHSLHLQSEAKNLIRRQMKLIQLNQNKLKQFGGAHGSVGKTDLKTVDIQSQPEPEAPVQVEAPAVTPDVAPAEPQAEAPAQPPQ